MRPLLAARTGDVSIFTAAAVDMPGTPAERLAHNVLAVAGNFYSAGDAAVRHNLPGRPVNDLLLAALFTLGLGAALWRIRHPAMRLLLIWLGGGKKRPSKIPTRTTTSQRSSASIGERTVSAR